MDSTLELAVRALYLVLMLSMPPIVVASLVGLVISLIQAVTQLQEQTLTFGIKLIAVAATIFMMGGWIGAELIRFGSDIFGRFYLI